MPFIDAPAPTHATEKTRVKKEVVALVIRRFPAFALSFILLCTALFPRCAEAQSADEITALRQYAPTDLDSHWAADTLNDAIHADIVKGYPTGVAPGVVEVRPNASITRAEFVTMLVRATGLTSNAPAKTFTDVPSGTWFSEPIRIASSLGIVNGYEYNQFLPTKQIRRDEMAALIVRAFEHNVSWQPMTAPPFLDVPAYWAADAINRATAVKIVNGKGDGKYFPADIATRAEAVTVLSRALHLESSALPTDDQLNAVVLADLRERQTAFNARNFAELEAINTRYSTGAQHAMMRYAFSTLQSLLTDPEAPAGLTMEIRRTETPSARVLQKSNRYATVELTGGRFDLLFTVPGEAPEVSPDDSSGLVYLKKMPDGSWKMYSAHPPEAA